MRRLTCCGAVVGDVAVHVDGPTVDTQVPHAADKVAVPHGEVFRQVGNPAEQQRPSQVQRPAQVQFKRFR